MMNGSYEWQKFRTGERIQERIREAEAHRSAKQGDGNRAAPATAISIKTAVLTGVGLFLVIWLLASCAPTEVTTGVAIPAAQSTQSEAEVEANIAAINPADRKFFNAVGSTSAGTAASVDPADRKFFNATGDSAVRVLLPIPRH